MEKLLKNYLHLYLGCDCMVGSQKCKLESVNCVEDTCELGYEIDDEDSGFFGEYTTEQFPLFQIKPILIPLKNILSIEPHEKKQLLDAGLMYSHADDKYTIWNPETVRLACSFGVDLFSLINEGLAVDKSTIISTSAH